MSHWTLIAAFSTAIACSTVAYAEQKAKPLTTQDYVEIQQLYARYAWGVDTHANKGMVFALAFTPDGEFVLDGKLQATGHEALGKMMAGDGTPSTKASHVTTNIMIEPAPEGARGHAYLVTGGGVGTYSDVLVKTAEGWRFKQRKLNLKTLPSTSPFAN